jgi:hypothetical protein
MLPINEKYYPIAPENYLKRASYCLKQQDPQFLFYAALNLRCGIEARMREYLDVWPHISKSEKNNWKLEKLGKSCKRYFLENDTIQEITMLLEDGYQTSLRYHPITNELIRLGMYLGTLLHDQKKYRGKQDGWWLEQRLLLQNAGAHLDFACRGDLLGPALMRREEGEKVVTVCSTFIDSEKHRTLHDRMKIGKVGILKVEYLEFASEFTPGEMQLNDT